MLHQSINVNVLSQIQQFYQLRFPSYMMKYQLFPKLNIYYSNKDLFYSIYYHQVSYSWKLHHLFVRKEIYSQLIKVLVQRHRHIIHTFQMLDFCNPICNNLSQQSHRCNRLVFYMFHRSKNAMVIKLND